jgi:hypothetical protein
MFWRACVIGGAATARPKAKPSAAGRRVEHDRHHWRGGGDGAPGISAGRRGSRSRQAPRCRSPASSELRDELLRLFQLAVESVPLLGRALRESLARVAGVQLADGGHALPLLGPELPCGRRPLRIAAFCFPASASESHLFDPVPVARVATQQAHLPRGMEGTSCLPLRPHRDQPPALAIAGRDATVACDGRVAAFPRPSDGEGCAPPGLDWPRPRRPGGVQRGPPGACRRSGSDPLGDARQR